MIFTLDWQKFQIVVVIDQKTYSWEKVNTELLDNTELSIELIKKMKYLGIL